ncbi:hypothetical protein OE88DRAFT_1679776 [Heliocybe sulcata]|uniref:Uncharacterized protein n=1 Tax=Heliocybe sulcata TaxID=5364 RepID=A0A5C3N6E7_9AGAM|nr:hypothetical protein OE88DRAFT_1679776 [Heliocybe sulcata]
MGPGLSIGDEAVEDVPDSSPVDARESSLWYKQLTVNAFPGGWAGAPVDSSDPQSPSVYEKYKNCIDASGANPWAPFKSRLDWEFARWAKTRGPGSTAVTELLSIEGVHDALDLSYKNARELSRIIDEELTSGRPAFKREEIVISGEAFDVYFRDIMQCTAALFGDPEFASHLVFAPERHYADADKTTRVYHDMYTGKWWWSTQKILEHQKPGATIIPIIISSDKTQLTLFRNKTAYPVYMTIGNLPKEIRRKPSRRGQILLGYLPTTKLSHISNKAARRRALANLFHACMRHILGPIKVPGVEGTRMVSGDGVVRRGHPIFATYIGDYPEQVLVTGCKTGLCPKGTIPREALGSGTRDCALRDLGHVLDALAAIDEGPVAFTRACEDAGIKPIFHPFWEDLPYVNIFRSITPDILHQLYQGVVKHLLLWLKEVYGPVELDARCRRLPPNHNIRIFSNGITTLSKVTGKEHGDICRFLMALTIGLPPRNLEFGRSMPRLIRTVRALLDFLYLAQYPLQTLKTLEALENARTRFHENKSIFVELGVRSHFNLPKLHSLDHYGDSVQLFGTTDNYNTEHSERLHIDFAKDTYRATNKKDEFPQMTVWLERKEKIERHSAYIQWRLTQAAYPRGLSAPAPPDPILHIKMARHPSAKAVPFSSLVADYGAASFRDALARFVVKWRNPSLTAAQVERSLGSIYFRFRTVPVFHKIKFYNEHAMGYDGSTQALDVVRVRPSRKDKRQHTVPGRFDTVLVNDGTGAAFGVQGYRVGQIRVVFRLPKRATDDLFPGLIDLPEHLAYIEWFTLFSVRPDRDHRMYKISRQLRNDGARIASIIPISNIRRSCHLLPEFGPVVPREWTSSNVLDEARYFFVNCFLDRHTYMTVY